MLTRQCHEPVQGEFGFRSQRHIGSPLRLGMRGTSSRSQLLRSLMWDLDLVNLTYEFQLLLCKMEMSLGENQENTDKTLEMMSCDRHSMVLSHCSIYKGPCCCC